MNPTDEQLKIDVLRRIHRVYFVRTFMYPFIIECAVLGGLIGSVPFFVSIQNVIDNAYANQSIGTEFVYILSAFKNTELSVKLIALAMLVVSGLVVRDTFIGIGRAARHVRSAF